MNDDQQGVIITTLVTEFKIDQTTIFQSNGKRTELSHMIMLHCEQQLRDALIKLGWTPPPDNFQTTGNLMTSTNTVAIAKRNLRIAELCLQFARGNLIAHAFKLATMKPEELDAEKFDVIMLTLLDTALRCAVDVFKTERVLKVLQDAQADQKEPVSMPPIHPVRESPYVDNYGNVLCVGDHVETQLGLAGIIKIGGGPLPKNPIFWYIEFLHEHGGRSEGLVQDYCINHMRGLRTSLRRKPPKTS